MVHFEWDREKAQANARKHGVTFEEAATVFGDALARIFDDDAYSVLESREIIVGYETNQRILLVSFVIRKENVRIISARQATRKEQQRHEKR